MIDASLPGNYLYIHFDRQNRDVVLAAVSRLQSAGFFCLSGKNSEDGRLREEKQAQIASAAAIISFLSPQAQLSSAWRRDLLQVLSQDKQLILVPLGQVPVTPVLQRVFSRLTVCPLLEEQRDQWAGQMAAISGLRPALGTPQTVEILPWPAALSGLGLVGKSAMVLRNLLTQETYPCLTPSFVLGRSQQKADYVFSRKSISREQVSLSYRQSAWWLTALSENTPSFLNGSLASPGKAYPLKEGDEISFAGERLRLEEVPGQNPVPPAVSGLQAGEKLSLQEIPGKMPVSLAAACLQVESSSAPDLSPGLKIPVSDLPFTLGRSAACQLQIKVRTVSSHHGEISRQEENYYFTDLGSTNGSRLNGQSLKAHTAYPLKNQDLLQLHEESFRFLLS